MTGPCSRLTPAHVVGRATVYLSKVFHQVFKYRQSLQNRARKPSIPMREDPDVMGEYERVMMEELEEAQRMAEEIKSWLHSVAEKYDLQYLQYYLDTPLSDLAAVAVLAHPPDCTWRYQGAPPVTKPSTWVNKVFFKRRIKQKRGEALAGGLIPRVFRTLNQQPLLTLIGRSARRYEWARRLYDEKKRQYMERGHPKARAHLIALRDVLRVFIGNMWLVATMEALEKGIIKPSDVVVTYEIAENPQRFLAEAVDPEATVSPASTVARRRVKWSTYSWHRLIQMLNVQPQNPPRVGQ